MFWKRKNAKLIANVIEGKCRNCNYCIHICRHKVFESTIIEEKKCTFVNRPDKCTGCGKCARNCPEQAIEMIEKYV